MPFLKLAHYICFKRGRTAPIQYTVQHTLIPRNHLEVGGLEMGYKMLLSPACTIQLLPY